MAFKEVKDSFKKILWDNDDKEISKWQLKEEEIKEFEPNLAETSLFVQHKSYAEMAAAAKTLGLGEIEQMAKTTMGLIGYINETVQEEATVGVPGTPHVRTDRI